MRNMPAVLVVEDESAIAELIAVNLRHNGFRPRWAMDSESAQREIDAAVPDLILLDWMLPGESGLTLAKRWRTDPRTKDTPIIMLTARGDEADRVAGLDAGADDYIAKPFSTKELLARVRAVLRRLPGERGPEKIGHGDLTINFLKHEAFLEGKPLNLTPIEFKVLGALVKEPGRVFSRAQIIEKALGHDFDGFDRTIDVHILKLRRKLEPDPHHPRFIKTVYGAGYKLLENNGVSQP